MAPRSKSPAPKKAISPKKDPPSTKKDKKYLAPPPSSSSSSSALLGIVICTAMAPLILRILELFPELTSNHIRLGVSATTALITFTLVMIATFRLLKVEMNVLAYVFVFVTFTSCVDTCVSLALLVPEAFPGEFYYEHGERYFKCAYGFFCLFWDGTFHLVMQGVFAYLIIKKQDFHFPALIWAGSVLNSMIPLLMGAATGPHSKDIQVATAFNGPYVFLPVVIIVVLLTKASRKAGPGDRVKTNSIWADLALFAFHIGMILLHTVRCMTVLDSQAPITLEMKKLEPILTFREMAGSEADDLQDFAFIRIQIVQWFLWFVPWHCAALYEQVERIRTNKRTVLLGTYGVDLAAVVFGGYLQSVACYAGTLLFDWHAKSVTMQYRTLVKIPSFFWLICAFTLIGSGLHVLHLHVQDVEDV